MIAGLPGMRTPEWLATMSRARFVGSPLPLRDILTDSFYYPSARFDLTPIVTLAGNFRSFVYVDYGVTRAGLLEAARQVLDGDLARFVHRDYDDWLATRLGLADPLDDIEGDILLEREVAMDELPPIALVPEGLRAGEGMPVVGGNFIKPQFCHWAILEGPWQDRAGNQGPISLLYIGAEAVAAYQSLYVAQGLSCAGLAVIQPGNKGGNYTDFERQDGILARTVMDNPAGRPGVLMSGGYSHWRWGWFDRVPRHGVTINGHGHGIAVYRILREFREPLSGPAPVVEPNWCDEAEDEVTPPVAAAPPRPQRPDEQTPLLDCIAGLSLPSHDDGIEFTDPTRLNAIREMLLGAGYAPLAERPLAYLYRHRDFSPDRPFVLVSCHIDSASGRHWLEVEANTISGSLDNCACNGALVHAMRQGRLPAQAVVAFTGDEEDESRGADQAMQVLGQLGLRPRLVMVICLDVTEEGYPGHAVTAENYFVANPQPWPQLQVGRKREFGQLLAGMVPGILLVPDDEAEADEAWQYDEHNVNVFSLCMPGCCIDPVGGDMHDGMSMPATTPVRYTTVLVNVAHAVLDRIGGQDVSAG